MSGVEAGDTVRIHYTGRLADGTAFDSSEGRDPLEVVVGSGQIIVGLDAALPGMAVGERKRVEVAADAGYGPRLPERIKQIPLAEMPEELGAHVGMEIELQDPSGRVLPAVIVRILDGEAYCDMNHPLAGQDLTFDVELVEKL